MAGRGVDKKLFTYGPYLSLLAKREFPAITFQDEKFFPCVLHPRSSEQTTGTIESVQPLATSPDETVDLPSISCDSIDLEHANSWCASLID